MTDPRADRLVGILTTRVGRRFVLMFLGCAFVPLLVFALLSYGHVSAELRRQNEVTLHDGARTAGMGIAARLSQLAGDFDLLREAVQRQQAGQPAAAVLSLTGSVRKRCAAVGVVRPEGAQVLWGAASPPPPTDAQALAHLAKGKVLLVSRGEPALLLAFAALQPGAADSPLLAAELDAGWLWDVQELRGRGAEVAVFDGRQWPLFHSFERLPELATLRDAVVRESASGGLEWPVAGVPHVARYWRLFLQPQYGLDLLVVQSRPRRDALTAVYGFATWFAALAFGTLLCVLVASLVQMRRTLEPIVALGAATRRVAAGDYGVRVAIRSRDEFGALGTAFNQMTAQLGENVRRREQTERDLVTSRDAALQAARAKAEFVTNVSHEFRTPMAEILGATEILTSLGDADPAARLEFAVIAHSGAQRLSRLVDDVLELGSSAPWQLEPTRIESSLAAAVGALPPNLARRVRMEVDGNLPPVLAVATRLQDLWQRLLDNAVKFSSAEAPIELRATVRGEEVQVEVEDHGVGISRLDLEHVFEPFQQVGRNQLTEKAHGTGLGLAIARSTVQRLGGRIEVDSELGRGSCFRVVLPVAAAAAPAAPTAPALTTQA